MKSVAPCSKSKVVLQKKHGICKSRHLGDLRYIFSHISAESCILVGQSSLIIMRSVSRLQHLCEVSQHKSEHRFRLCDAREMCEPSCFRSTSITKREMHAHPRNL